MTDQIELQKRINKQIPVTDCIAYVKDDEVHFDFIRIKQMIKKPIKSLNLSNDAISALILDAANDMRAILEDRKDQSTIEH